MTSSYYFDDFCLIFLILFCLVPSPILFPPPPLFLLFLLLPLFLLLFRIFIVRLLLPLLCLFRFIFLWFTFSSYSSCCCSSSTSFKSQVPNWDFLRQCRTSMKGLQGMHWVWKLSIHHEHLASWEFFKIVYGVNNSKMSRDWGVAKGSSVSWVAKFKGYKNSECKLSNEWSRSYKVAKLLASAGKWAVAKLQGDKSAPQSSMELYYPWISGPLRISW